MPVSHVPDRYIRPSRVRDLDPRRPRGKGESPARPVVTFELDKSGSTSLRAYRSPAGIVLVTVAANPERATIDDAFEFVMRLQSKGELPVIAFLGSIPPYAEQKNLPVYLVADDADDTSSLAVLIFERLDATRSEAAGHIRTAKVGR